MVGVLVIINKMKHKNKAIDVKFQELNINHYSSLHTQLENIQVFIEEFGGDERFELLKRNIDYLKADALFNIKDYEEALLLFNQLYQDESDLLRPVIAQRIVEQLIMLNHEDEALTLIADSLKGETNLVYKLDMLFWAVTKIKDADAKLRQYSNLAKEISVFIGLVIPPEHTTFSASIRFLKLERNEASRRYNILMMKNRGLPRHEQIEALESYIEQEVVTEYKQLAKESLKHYTQ